MLYHVTCSDLVLFLDRCCCFFEYFIFRKLDKTSMSTSIKLIIFYCLFLEWCRELRYWETMEFVWLWIWKGVCLASLVSPSLSLPFSPPNGGQRNCTNCLLGANINHIKRIERIKQQIITSLGFQKDTNGKIIDVFPPKTPREGPSGDQIKLTHQNIRPIQNDEANKLKLLPPSRVSEEIILSELAGKLFFICS